MAAKILDGEALAARIRQGLKAEIDNLKLSWIMPRLVALQVGENAASRVYTKQQKMVCDDMGIFYELKELAATVTQEELISQIQALNSDKKVAGIILQMPLPSHIKGRAVQVTISPDKDVEGLHPVNMGMLVYGNVRLAPPTALAAIELLKSTGVELKGKEVTIVGHSEIVGKPLLLMMLQSQLESATPTVCHIATKDLALHTKKADILMVAAGKPGLIKADMIKQGAIVIDIGINRVPLLDGDGKPLLDEYGRHKKKTVGDVDFEGAKEVCSYISPVPKGVGPVTVMMLIKNIVTCAKLNAH